MSEQVHNAVPIVPQPQRKVTFYSTKTGRKESIETNVTTWAELKPLINNALGIDVNKFLATETVGKHTLELDVAELPRTAFQMIIRPKDTKGGAKAVAPYPLNRKELMASIKEFTTADPKLKEKLGGNIPQMKTTDMEVFHKKYIAGKTVKPATTAVPKTAAKTTAPKKEAVSKAKETTKAPAKAKAAPALKEKAPAKTSTTSRAKAAFKETANDSPKEKVVAKEEELTAQDFSSMAKSWGIR